MPTLSRVFRFGANELDTANQVLTRAGRRIPIRRLPLDLLSLLVENRGQLVSRDQIVAKLWANPQMVDSVAGLNTAVSQLRAALNDNPVNPRFIETVSGRGYRFCGDVEVIVRQEPAVVVEQPPLVVALPQSAEPEPVPVLSGPKVKFRAVWAFAAAAFCLFIAALYFARRPIWLWSGPEAGAPQSIAVLPIRNLLGDPNQEYLVDGLTDQMITDLIQFKSLRVLSRTSVMRFKDTHESLPEIASALRADLVVEASITNSGDKLHLIVQLLDGRQDRHLWAASYDCNRNELNSLSAKVALQVGTQATAGRGAQEAVHPASAHTINPAAYDVFLQARYASQKHTPEETQKALTLFQQAVNLDPNSGKLHSGLAAEYMATLEFSLMPMQEAVKLATAEAQNAIRLDGSAQGHAVLANIEETYKWNWAEAEAEYRKQGTHSAYGTFLSRMGRHDEGLAEIRRALEDSPLSLEMITQLGTSLYLVLNCNST